MDVFDGVMIDEYDWEHHKLDGKSYDIRFDRSRMEWACDCKACLLYTSPSPRD